MQCFPIEVRENISNEMRLSVIREPHIWKFVKLIKKIEGIVLTEGLQFEERQRAALNHLLVEHLHRVPHISSSYPVIVDSIETIVLKWEVYDRESQIIDLKREIAKIKRENSNLRKMLLQ